jgi:hypothetical protein
MLSYVPVNPFAKTLSVPIDPWLNHPDLRFGPARVHAAVRGIEQRARLTDVVVAEGAAAAEVSAT